MNQYKEIVNKIKRADAILIGASNGLSITEGLHLFADNQAMEELLGYFKRKYGLRNVLDGCFYPWETLEEKWGFLSRVIKHYTWNYEPTPVMKNLRTIVGDKPYFVITSNNEGHFEQCGFEGDRVFEIEGNWIEMRCSNGCHDEVYSTKEAVEQMAEKEENGLVPTESIPRCPKCGEPMELYNSQPPKKQVERNWEEFQKDFHNKNIVILELGIGWRNQLIKAPLMQMTAAEPDATYVTINLGEIYIEDNIIEKSYGLDGFLDAILEELAQAYKEI